MEIHQLRYFLAVARVLNFTRAADACHVSQPSLSQQILKLEDELGERLFERSKKEVLLTPAGHQFALHAQRVLEELEEAREQVRGVGGSLRGRLVLGAIPTVAPYFLPEKLRAFVARHPAVELVVHEDTTPQLAEQILARELDLAVLSLPVERPGLASLELFREKLLVALPAAHALARRRGLELGDLKSETFVLMKEGHCLAGQALQFCQLEGFQPKISFRSAQIDTLLAFVASGWGVSIVPEMAARSHRRTGVVYREVSGLSRSVGLVWRASRLHSAQFSAVKDHFSRG